MICPLTTTIRTDADQFRIDVIGGGIGVADDALRLRVNRALALFLSIV